MSLPRVVGASLFVPEALVNNRLKKQLTLLNTGVAAANEAGINGPPESQPTPYVLEWREAGDGAVWAPRKTKLPTGTELGEAELPAWGRKFKFESRITLRPHQAPAFEALVDPEARKLREGVLSLNVGFGKTALLLHALSAIETGPVLVVVPDGSLLTQWKTRAEEQLSFIEGGIGQIGDGVLDVAGRGLVIGIVDSVSSPKLPQSVCNLFEHVILDESHSLCTPEGSQLFWRFPGRRVALSATWKRRDGMHKLAELHVGKVLYESMRVDMPIKQVTLVETDTVVRDFARVILSKPEGSLTRQDYMKIGFLWTGVKRALAAKKERNDLIVSYLEKALTAGRTVLFLAPSVPQLRYIYSKVNASDDEKCLITGKDAAIAERHELMQGKRLVVATEPLAKQGIDYPALDCLVLSNPLDPQQAFGRVQRGLDGKKEPVVVCFTDMQNPSAARQAVRFCANVEKLGYPVKKLSK